MTLKGYNFRGKDNDTCDVWFWDTKLNENPLTAQAAGVQEQLKFTLPKSPHPATALELTGQAVPIKVSCGSRTSAVNSDIFSYVREPQRLLGNAGDNATSPALIRLKDLNNDMKPDLVVTTANSQCRIFTLIGDGKGSFDANMACRFTVNQEATVIALDVGLLSGSHANDVVVLVRTSDNSHYIDFLFGDSTTKYQRIDNIDVMYSAFLSGSVLNISKSKAMKSYLEKWQWKSSARMYDAPELSRETSLPVTYYTKCGPNTASGAIFGSAAQMNKVYFLDFGLNELTDTGLAAGQPQRIICTSLGSQAGSQVVIATGNPISSFLISDLSTRPLRTEERKIPNGQIINPGIYMSIRPGDMDGDGKNDLAMISDSEHGQVFLLQSHNQWQLETVKTGLGVHRDVEVADLNGDGLADVVLPGTDSDGKGGVFVYLSYRP